MHQKYIIIRKGFGCPETEFRSVFVDTRTSYVDCLDSATMSRVI